MSTEAAGMPTDLVTLIDAGPGGTTARKVCDHCAFEYFGVPNADSECVSCAQRPGKRRGTCPACKESLPLGARYCRSCGEWIAEKESAEAGFVAEPTVYDVTMFGANTCRAYLAEIAERVVLFAEQTAASLTEIDDLRCVQMYGVGGSFTWTHDPGIHLINQCAMVQWTYCKGDQPVEETVQRLDAALGALAPQIERLCTTAGLLDKDKDRYRTVIKRARATMTAALGGTTR